MTAPGRTTAIVTGGAGGIGRAVLARLRADGFRPVSWDLAADAPAELALAVDVTDADALAAAAARTAALGPTGALVVNAGILGPVARLWELARADIRRVIETNLVSAFLTLRAVVRTAMERSIREARRADRLARIPRRRFVEPEEMAATVSFPCGKACSFSTGAVFDLSGGRATS